MGWLRSRRVALPALAAGLIAIALAAGTGALADSQLRGPALADALRNGGYVVFFRHAATDFSQEDTDTQTLRNCLTQRNLTAAGRADARAIGRAFRSLRIPVGTVLASRYCRTRETARLAFRRVRTTLDLTSLPSAATAAERNRRIAALRGLLGTRPRRGVNTVLVGHLFNIEAATGITLEEGEAAVFRPLRRSRYRVVAKVMARRWTSLRRLAAATELTMREYRLPAGKHPHDVAPARDGGLNAIVRVDPRTRRVRRYRLPATSGYANLNTATFDRRGVLWFTGQAGVYGRLDPRRGKVRVFRAPRGAGPYGITTTPSGAVYYASLAGSYVGRIDVARGTATVLRPPTAGQGARRAWSDSRSRIWISEWNAGRLGMYEPARRRWREW